MSRLDIRRRADRDIDEQLVYLAKQSHRVASRFLDAVEKTFQLLAELPDRGVLDEFTSATENNEQLMESSCGSALWRGRHRFMLERILR